jgi:hypothetical protein
MLTSASYKKDFNKGVLLVTYMRSHIKEGSKVKYQDLEVLLRLLVREEFIIALNPSS